MVRTRGWVPPFRPRGQIQYTRARRPPAPVPVPSPVPSPVPEVVPEEPQGFRRYQTRMGTPGLVTSTTEES